MLEFKIPESVLVVIYSSPLDVLLLERADHPGFWQSVTGSRAQLDEPLRRTCQREVAEETGYQVALDAFDDLQLRNCYEIYPHWRHRYAPGVTQNMEHVFGLRAPEPFVPVLSAREHLRFCWLPWQEAADKCFSWTNSQAIKQIAAALR